jgi:hypothetical protein
MSGHVFTPPLQHLHGLFRAVELGKIPTDLAPHAYVDHEPTCATQLYYNSYAFPASCTCDPKVTFRLASQAMECLPDGRLRPIVDQ